MTAKVCSHTKPLNTLYSSDRTRQQLRANGNSTAKKVDTSASALLQISAGQNPSLNGKRIGVRTLSNTQLKRLLTQIAERDDSFDIVQILKARLTEEDWNALNNSLEEVKTLIVKLEGEPSPRATIEKIINLNGSRFKDPSTFLEAWSKVVTKFVANFLEQEAALKKVAHEGVWILAQGQARLSESLLGRVAADEELESLLEKATSRVYSPLLSQLQKCVKDRSEQLQLVLNAVLEEIVLPVVHNNNYFLTASAQADFLKDRWSPEVRELLIHALLNNGRGDIARLCFVCNG